jgi:ubiquitin-like 1-activating enzyme E1 A
MDHTIPDESLYKDYHDLYSGLGFLHAMSTPHPATSSSGSNDINDKTQGLTVEEQRVYDRQIRTWGLEAQNKMRKAKVLVIGHFNSLAAEICKNLTLAGIGELILCDNNICNEKSFGGNFLLGEGYTKIQIIEQNQNFKDWIYDEKNESDFVSNYSPENIDPNFPPLPLTEAQASIPGLSILNPNVKISHVMKPLGDIGGIVDVFSSQKINFVEISLVIACGIDIIDATYLNNLCHINNNYNTQFVYCDLVGKIGIGFFDFN